MDAGPTYRPVTPLSVANAAKGSCTGTYCVASTCWAAIGGQPHLHIVLCACSAVLRILLLQCGELDGFRVGCEAAYGVHTRPLRVAPPICAGLRA